MAASLVDLPGEMLDKITETLQKVGIDLPTLFVQISLLVLSAAILALMLHRRLKPEKRHLRPFQTYADIPILVVSLMVIAVPLSWALQLRAPRTIFGQIDGARPTTLTVELLDLKRKMIVSMDLEPDHETGAFHLQFPFKLGRPPRFIAVQAACCSAEVKALEGEPSSPGSPLHIPLRDRTP